MGSRKRSSAKRSATSPWNVKKATVLTILLVSIYQIGQLYEFFGDVSTVKHNWILFAYRPMTTAWNVNYLSQVINPVITAWLFIIGLKYLAGLIQVESRKHDILNVAYGYFAYTVLDLLYYFINFKTDWYNSIWIFLAIIEFFIIKKQKQKA